MAKSGEQKTTEVEWQFSALDVRPVMRWLAEQGVPGFETRETGTRSLHDVYFDTDDWRVHHAGYTLRVRKTGTGAEVTMKSMAEAVDGVRTRTEHTEKLAEDPPADLRTLPGGVGDALRSIAGKQPLHPLFMLDTERHALHISDALGSLGEVALDSTAIPVDAEDHPVRFTRVEVEVESVERARPFVDALVAAAALQPATTSKFQAALVATGRTVPPTLPDLGPTALSPGMTATQYAVAVLRRHLAVLLANEPGARMGEDAEFVHDMRVASRRIRATMSAFDPYLPLPVRRLRPEMGWLTGVLGEVRDLDVQLDQLAGWRASLPGLPPSALDQLEAALRSRRERERKRMLVALDSRRHDRLVERFIAALRRDIPRTVPAARVPVLAVAPKLVEKRYRRVRRLGDLITPQSPPADYHALRIEAKKLRYACEFAAPLYDRPAADFAIRVTALQDVLGEHQDADVAVQHLLALAQENRRRFGPEAHIAIGMMTERYNVRAAALRGEFPAVYSRLRGRAWAALRRRFQKLAPPAATVS